MSASGTSVPTTVRDPASGLMLWYCLLCGMVVVNIQRPTAPPESCHCGCREFGFAGKAEGGIRP